MAKAHMQTQNMLQTIVIGRIRQARTGNILAKVVSLIKPPLTMDEISLLECSKLVSAAYHPHINQLRLFTILISDADRHIECLSCDPLGFASKVGFSNVF